MQHSKTLRALILASALAIAACSSPQEQAATHLAKAQQFYDAGNFVKARLEAQSADQLEPKNARAKFLLALVAEQNKDYRGMVSNLQAVAFLDPGNLEARLKLGNIYLLGQMLPQAAEQADALLKLAPKDARVHLLQARVLIQKGEQAAGITEIGIAIKLDPDNMEGLLFQSSVYAIESVGKGLATIDQTIARLTPAKTKPLREMRVVLLFQAKRMADVEHDLQSLVADFPKEGEYPFQLGRFYASQGRTDEADRFLKRAADLDPADVDKRLGYVQFLATARSPERAEAALKAFIDQMPKAGKLRLALGQLYERAKRLDEARAAYRQLVDLEPKSAEGFFARTRIAALNLQAGKIDAARATLDKLLVEAPRDSSVLLLQAQVYRRMQDLTRARDTYRRLLVVDPDSAEGLEQLVMLYAAEKDFAAAESLLRGRLEKHPDDRVASGHLVELLMAQGKADQAEDEARLMAALPSQPGVGDFELGWVLAQNKDLAGATAAFRKSAAARKDDPLPLEGLVRSLVAQGKREEAIGVLKGQLEKGQNQLFAKLLLGGLYGQQGNKAQAEQYIEEVIKSRPDLAAGYVVLAEIYRDDREVRIHTYQRGLAAIPGSTDLAMLLCTDLQEAARYDEAIASYENLLKKNPAFVPAANNLASLLNDHRTDKASIARALELARSLPTDDNVVLLDTLGWAHYRAGQLKDAVGVLEKAVARSDKFPIFQYHLGMAYLATGNKAGARLQLDAALRPGAGDFPGRTAAEAARATL